MRHSSVLNAYTTDIDSDGEAGLGVGAAAGAQPPTSSGEAQPKPAVGAGRSGAAEEAREDEGLGGVSAGAVSQRASPGTRGTSTNTTPAAPLAEPPAPGPPGPPARRPHVLLAVTGSVAAVKTVQLAARLLVFAEVRVAATRAARPFLAGLELPAGCLPLLDDEGEWRDWRGVGDAVLHIELRRWADALVVAPLSANTLAKLACGLCDNLVTCVVRAWDFAKPVLVRCVRVSSRGKWERRVRAIKAL